MFNILIQRQWLELQSLSSPTWRQEPGDVQLLSQESIRLLELEIDTLLKMELYSYLLQEKFQRGVMYKKSLIAFMEKYAIADTNEHGLMKAFQRWNKSKEGGEKRGGVESFYSWFVGIEDFHSG